MPSKDKYNELCILDRDVKGFLDIADFIRERNIDMSYYVFYASPYAVNLSFSIELSIKELRMLLDIPNEREHNLYNLYSKLPEDIKKKAEEVFHELCQEYISSSNIRDNRVNSSTTVESVLQTYGRAFEDWRYLHESHTVLSVPHDDLLFAAKAIRTIAYQEMQKYCSDIGEEPDYIRLD